MDNETTDISEVIYESVPEERNNRYNDYVDEKNDT